MIFTNSHRFHRPGWLPRAITVGMNEAVADLAIDAFYRYGKGRQPAGLNFGDCFSYALARRLGLPLLSKGGDFSRADVGVPKVS